MHSEVRPGRPLKPISVFKSRHVTFALALRKARRGAGMSQGELATRTGKSRDHIGRLERGDTLPEKEFVRRACAIFKDPALQTGYELALAQRNVPVAGAASGPVGVLDVVGIGMSNVDLIAGTSALSRNAGHPITEYGSRFDWTIEQVVDRATFDRVHEYYGADLFSTTLGGSAFNAIRTLAQLDLGLRLGYLSLQGQETPHDVTHRDEMQRLGVDVSFVEDVAGPSGRCISYIDDDGRRLLTCMGSNVLYGTFVDERFLELLDYLRHARLIHVTSAPDAHTEVALLKLLTRLRADSPLCTICIDPGSPWTTDPRPAVTKIIALADYVILNYREFKLLGEATPGEFDDVIARRALEHCGPTTALVVAERYDRVQMFRRSGDGVSASAWRVDPVEPGRMEDVTGAGDVFDAGFIAALSSGRIHCEMGVLLGSALAKTKLGDVGAADDAALGAVTSAMLSRLRHGSDDESLELCARKAPTDGSLRAHTNARYHEPAAANPSPRSGPAHSRE